METMTEKPATVESRVAQDVAKFNPAEAKLATFREYLTYRINGLADKDGQKMVYEARQEVKGERLEMDKLRKKLTEDADKYKKGVDGYIKPYIDEMKAIEAHLQEQEDAIAEEKARIARAEQEAIQRKLEERRASLYAIGMNFNGQGYAGYGEIIGEISVVSLNDQEFAALVDKCRAAKKAEDDRKAAEAAAAKIEADRIAAERRKLDEERAALEAQQREQEAAAARVKAEQEARERAIREEAEAVERTKREAIEAEQRKVREAEEAKRREEERIATEARIAKEREEAAAAERIRIEAEAKARAEREEAERIERESKMTDRAKLKAYCAALLAIPQPEMKSKAGAEKVAAIATKLEEITTL